MSDSYCAECGQPAEADNRGRTINHTCLTREGYEAAAARYDTAAVTYGTRRRELLDQLTALDDEFAAAAADLARYEVKPGVPLPEFRAHTLAAIDKILGA